MMDSSDPFIGLTLDGYQIDSLLGRGGMGAVYQATDIGLGRRVALKMLLQRSSNSKDLVQRFQREAHIVAELNHPNIATIYRIGTYEDTPYYAMEFIEGQSLAEMIFESRRLGGAKCIKYMTQCAQGLKAAARHQIIHRDIKPANIMITTDGLVKVVDFGLAKAMDHEDTFQTATGAIMGTPRYMSPEQAKGQTLDLRSDIYSLGATFYHMVTGYPPFEADTSINLLMKHVNEPLVPVRQRCEHVPKRLAHLIEKMMAKEVDDRLQDYDELLMSLENIYSDPSDSEMSSPALPKGVSLRNASVPEEADKVQSKRMKYILVACGVFVALVMVFSYAGRDDGNGGAVALAPDAVEVQTQDVDLLHIDKADRKTVQREAMDLIRAHRDSTAEMASE